MILYIPRCKIDRRHSHFRANILHQKKSHNSRKKKVNWREQCYVSVVRARSVANLLCPDKRSLVLAQVRNWRGTPSPSPQWKVLPTPLICCLKIVIRWCCALQTIRRLAFLFRTNLKHALSSCTPGYIYWKKNEAIISLVVIRCAL